MNANSLGGLSAANGGNSIQLQHQQAVNIQRRASQGSSNSGSTTASSGTTPNGHNNYAMSNGGCYPSAAGLGHHGTGVNRSISQGQSCHVPPNPSSLCSNAEQASSSPSSIPPISNNAPPPPPPPPGSLKGGAGAKPTSLADQLKQAQLKKVSSSGAVPSTIPGNGSALNRTSSSSGDTGIGSKSSTINSTNSGHSDLLSELAAKINKRNNKNQADSVSNSSLPAAPSSSSLASATGETAAAATTGASSGNGGAAPAGYRPWQKGAANAATLNGPSTAPSVDSPRVHRKVPSGSSLSSQEETAPSRNGTVGTYLVNGNGGISASSSSSNATTAALGPPAQLTSADLERFKQELFVEFQREVNKAKQEILSTLRQELAHMQQQR